MIKINPRDKVVFIGETFLLFGLEHGCIYRVIDVRECGGCEGEGGQHIDIGIRHTGKFTQCACCKNIIDMDDAISVPRTMFRLATPDEENIYNEFIVAKSLKKTHEGIQNRT